MKQKGTNWAHTTGTHSAESDFDSDMTMDSMADMMGNSSNTGIVYLGGEPYNLEQGDTNYMVG
nr:hypothetical protein [Gammaproteobacteria bacterium]NIW50387.1 hypothetical protein [Gammaproteobacteria bacterium]